MDKGVCKNILNYMVKYLEDSLNESCLFCNK